MARARAASQTAVLVAGYRARASEGANPVCSDPWARALAGESAMSLCERWDEHAPAMELWVALRTRYIDECVERALAAGVAQVVVLGAGLDTRAARLASAGVRFFEVDHPASQEEKRSRLAALQGYPLRATTFVACDFEHDDFIERLTSAGFDPNRRSVFVWEGVVYYLVEEAARSTLRRIATELHPSSLLVFDYLNSHMARSSERLRDEDRAMKGIIEELGEPMRYGIDDPAPLMWESGYRFLRTVSFDELALQYTGTYERARFFRFQAIATASADPEGCPW